MRRASFCVRAVLPTLIVASALLSCSIAFTPFVGAAPVAGTPAEVLSVRTPLPVFIPTPAPSPEILPVHPMETPDEAVAEVSEPSVPPTPRDAALEAMDGFVDAPFCISANIPRYLSYWRENQDMPMDRCMAFVNVNLDLGFFNDIVEISQPDSLYVLVSKNFALPEDYAPETLTPLSDSWHSLRPDAADAYAALKQAMSLEGLPLVSRSGYRSFADQRYTNNNIVSQETRRLGSKEAGLAAADRMSARPGMSEHQTGLAVDMTQPMNGGRLGAARFEQTAQYAWLLENAHLYGFILRYPDGFDSVTGFVFEPWHWRYIGVPAATLMYDEGIPTFEEYYGKYCISSQD